MEWKTQGNTTLAVSRKAMNKVKKRYGKNGYATNFDPVKLSCGMIA